MKKITLGIVFSFGLIVLAGCGNGDEKIPAPAGNQGIKSEQKADNKKAIEKNLPEATGDVDKTTDAILEIAGDEDAIISDEEKDAEGAVSLEEQDINDLSNSYDENEL